MTVTSLPPRTYSRGLISQLLALQQPWVFWLHCINGMVSVGSSLSRGPTNRVPQPTLDTTRSVCPHTMQSGVTILRQWSSLSMGSRKRKEAHTKTRWDGGVPGIARGQTELLRLLFVVVVTQLYTLVKTQKTVK